MMQLSDDEYDSASASVDDRGGKIVHDPIHGQITLAPLLLRLLDTPEFQRLRDLKQLGCAYLVFPGASHNRFEHSMGVAHLAELMLSHLRDTQPELGITPRDIELVKVAGLCHDLGHGPFSHCFEEFMHMARPDSEYRHERMSLQMLEVIINKNSLPFSAEDLQFLRELINPYDNPSQTHPRRFLYDIVANARNSIDVDKFDYLQRDCHNLGMSTSLKHDRLIKHCRVIDNEICFNSKEVYNLYELFHTRYSLHKQVYSHRVSKSIEYMICDVFLLADPVLHIADATEDVAAYAKLTDCVLKEIENSVDPRLAEARKLIMRIRTRQLYKLVDETVLPVDAPTVLGEVTVAQLLDCYPPSRAVLSPSDLHVQNLRINYAMKDKNPVDSVKFFHKHHRDISFRIPKEKVSHVIPQHFQERILRVFLKDVTEEKMNAAQETVRYFLEHNRCLTPNMQPMRSLSSPPELHATKPVRGGSNFTKMAAAAAAAAQQQNRQQHRSRIAEGAADEDEAEEDIPPSQNTTQTADVEASSGGSSQMMDDAVPSSKPYANGNHSAMMERLAAASASSASSAAAGACVSFSLPEANFAPAAAAAAAPLHTPTKPQAKSARRNANVAAATAAVGSPERSPPATVLLDRYAPRAEAATPAAASSAAAPSAAAASAGRSTPRGGSANTLGVPPVASASATPHKRRANALTNPTTPAGKLAAQVAASRGNTPATGSRSTPAAAATSSTATPSQQQSNKRQRVAINTPLAMQPLVPNSSARTPSPAPDQGNGGLPPAPITRAGRANSAGRKGDNDAAAAAAPAAAAGGRPARTPSLTAKTLQY